MTASLRELEERLEREPEDVVLRATVAGALREANRANDAIEHYRKVAIAYRSQGSPHEALAVCKLILELAPDDIAIHALVTDLERRIEPPRRDAGGARDAGDADGGFDVEFSDVGDDPGHELPPIRNDPTLVPRGPGVPGDHGDEGAWLGAGAGFESESESESEIDEETSPIEIKRPVVRVVVPSPAGTRGASPRTRAPSAPMRKSGTFETETPLPVPIPYHIADPTSAKARVPVSELDDVDETTETRPGPPVRPPSEPGTAGLAKAARRISGMFTNLASNDVAQELETREHVRLSADDLGLISRPPPTVPIEPVDLDDAPTPIPDWAGVVTRPGPGAAHDTPAPGSRASRPPDEDELTAPIEKLPAAPIANAFFVALPAPLREAALARCLARNLPAGTTVIRHGEAGHPLILVVRGQLEVRHDRPSLGLGSSVALETIDAGEFIGEAALLARSPASASVVAVTESDVLAVPSHAVFELAGAYPALWAALKHSAERRMRRYDNLLRSHPT